MYFTFELSDGRYIVTDNEKTRLFKAPASGKISCKELEENLRRGCTCINVDHIVLVRPAAPEEIERYKYHGH